MTRSDEIRKLNRMSVEEFSHLAGEHLTVVETLDDLHRHFAQSVATAIAKNNQEGAPTVLILPYGPTGQYPLLCEMINRRRITLRETTIFFMDEYADQAGRAVSEEHPLSFRRQISWFWNAIAPELRPKSGGVIFPDEGNICQLQDLIEAVGGVEICYGGVGIHGHLAFNEPAPGIRDSGPRLVALNDFTITMNAIRSGIGGDLENFPRKAWTLGMRQCLGARRIRLYCRNDVPHLDWANTVLRLTLLGEPGDDYPVTWIRDHPDWKVITDRNTIRSPEHLLTETV